MEKFIPFEKLSKKKQRKHNAGERRGWGVMNPVTRVTSNPKAYDRSKAKAIRRNDADSICLYCFGEMSGASLPSNR